MTQQHTPPSTNSYPDRGCPECASAACRRSGDEFEDGIFEDLGGMFDDQFQGYEDELGGMMGDAYSADAYTAGFADIASQWSASRPRLMPDPSLPLP